MRSWSLFLCLSVVCLASSSVMVADDGPAPATGSVFPRQMRPVACFEPDTPQWEVDEITERYSHGEFPLLGSDPEILGHRLSTRWSTTATDGSGLQQGDPTTITWSYLPDGTMINGWVGEASTPSNLHAWMNGIYGDFDTWHALYIQMFERWGELTGNTYVYEPNDDGVPLTPGNIQTTPGVLGVRGDVRIGAHNIPGGVLAYNWYPNIGDMVLDSGTSFYNNTGNNSRRLRNVLAHEHGHGIGEAHVCPVNQTKLMEPYATTAFDGPQHDDIRGGNRGYGDNWEPNDETSKPADIGEAFGFNLRASIDGTSDTDFYAFEVLGSDEADVSVTLSPHGQQYQEGPQCSNWTLIDTTDDVDLSIEVLDTDGTTVLGFADATGHGGSESLDEVFLPVPGTYYVHTMGGNDDVVQLYDLEVSVDRRPVPDPGGPYSVECDRPDVSLALDGSGSTDPDGGSVTLQWSMDCAGASFDDDTSPTPTATIPTTAGCPQVCNLTLDVTDDEGNTKSANQTVTISDTQLPWVVSIAGPAPNECYFANPFVTVVTGDICDPAPTGAGSFIDEPVTDPLDPACIQRSVRGQATDVCGNQSAPACGSSTPCPIPIFVNPNDCDTDGIPDCSACDAGFDMDCYASNCSKLQFGSGSGDGKINVQGVSDLTSCPAGTNPFSSMEPGDRVRILLDDWVAFDQPWSAFARSGAKRVWKYRSGDVSVLLNYEHNKWKFTDRSSDIGTGDVDNSDGVVHTLQVGWHLDEETLNMEETGRGDLELCRKGKSATRCR